MDTSSARWLQSTVLYQSNNSSLNSVSMCALAFKVPEVWYAISGVKTKDVGDDIVTCHYTVANPGTFTFRRS